MADQARILPANPRCTSGLAQILARETGGQKARLSYRLQVFDVSRQSNPRKTALQDASGARVDLAKMDRLVTSFVQAEFDAAYPGKQSGYGEATRTTGSDDSTHLSARIADPTARRQHVLQTAPS